jgi:hypothetical protein
MSRLFAVALLLAAGTAQATGLNISLQIPRLDVAEYHRPYIAAWIEHPDRSVATQLAVWYQQSETREGHGSKWLPDLRQWWRRGGRALEMPADGITGATRPPGKHSIRFAADSAAVSALAPGSYVLLVEASREVGGRELVQIPFDWPPSDARTLDAGGEHELGAVTLELVP